MSSSRRPSVLTHTPRGHEMSTQPTAVDAHAHGSNHRSPQTALKWSRTTRVQVTLHGCNKRPSTTYRRSPASCPGGPSPTAGPERRMQRARRTGRRHRSARALPSARLLGSFHSDVDRGPTRSRDRLLCEQVIVRMSLLASGLGRAAQPSGIR